MERRRVKRNHSTRHVGLPGDKMISVNESLSLQKKTLLAQVRAVPREKNYAYTWATWELCGAILGVTNLKNSEETISMKMKLLEDFKDKVSKLEEDLGLDDKLDDIAEIFQKVVRERNWCDVKEILETGKLSVEHRFSHRKTPLILTSENGHFSVVQYLVIERGACVNARDNVKGWSALHWAAYGGHRDVVEYLVTGAKMDPSQKTALSETPLHIAAERGHLLVVKYLWEKCNKNAFGSMDNGWTALHSACRGGHINVVEYLVTGAKMDPLQRTSLSETPLHIAAKGGSLDVIRFLLDTANVSIHDKDQNRMSTVHFAAERGHVHVVKYLWEKFNKTAFCSTDDGRTPLHFACRAGHVDVVMYLVEVGAVDKNAVDSYGRKAVDCAQGSNEFIIKKILS